MRNLSRMLIASSLLVATAARADCPEGCRTVEQLAFTQRQLQQARADLALAQGTVAAYAAREPLWARGTDVLRAQLATAQQAAQGARTRATVAVVVAIVGTGVGVAGVAARQPWVAVGGAVGVGGAIVVARW